MLEEWLQIANKNNYIKPKYYQGQYNLICRAYEDDLFPFLRKHGIHFNAFRYCSRSLSSLPARFTDTTSPLAGGFLTGKLTPNTPSSQLVGTRFEVADNNPFGRAARHWYDKPSMHEVNERLRGLAETNKMPMEELAMRWLAYHSALQSDDGIIIGASRPEQAQRTVNIIKAGPLTEKVATELSALWQICREEASGITSY